MLSRRRFLTTSSLACGCLGLGRAMPRLWTKVAAAAEATRTSQRLIVIELQGGNDGLNTVVPYADDAYYRARPGLGVPAKDVLKLDDHLGLNPVMKTWQPLWDAGKLAVVENCGYPDPNRSHFESMAIWHAGNVRPVPSGWLGRASDDADAGDLCYVGPGAVPHALSRKHRSVAALARLSDLELRRDTPDMKLAMNTDSLTAAIAARFEQARELSSQLPKTDPPAPSLLNGRERPLVERLRVIRTLLEKDQPYRVYYTMLDGFDNHANQRGTHDQLLRQASEAVSSFLTELEENKLADGVTVFLFSEFGRRVKENASLGTDHGAAAPVFLLGNQVKGGVHGGKPDLDNLDDGDLRHEIDFRDVYAAVLRGALGVDPKSVLGRPEPSLGVFA